MIPLRTFVVACGALLFLAVTAYSQSPTATISGVVHDQTDAVLPGVSSSRQIQFGLRYSF